MPNRFRPTRGTSFTKIALVFAACFICIAQAPAQEASYEYGTPAELKGVTKIYVDTGANLAARNEIMKVIRKRVPESVLGFADRAADAEVIIKYSADTSTSLTGVRAVSDGRGGAVATPQNETVTTGTGLVIKRAPEGSPRLLMSLTFDTRSLVSFTMPDTNFGRAFAKAYLEANGLKENGKKK